MNSYPNELLAQHVPLMFVAGLTEGSDPSPGPGSPTVPTSPPEAVGRSSSGSISQPSVPVEVAANTSGDAIASDPFAELVSRLRAVLTYRKKGAVWDPLRARAFQVILVDKVRLRDSSIRSAEPTRLTMQAPSTRQFDSLTVKCIHQLLAAR